MKKIGIIAGSNLHHLERLVVTHKTQVKTPYGEPSSALVAGFIDDEEVVFLSRRGEAESLVPPHKINYRANLWALRDAGVNQVVATSAVAGITSAYQLSTIVLPDQLIDYTYGRENTFFGDEGDVNCIDFSHPFSKNLRETLITIATTHAIPLQTEAVYGVMQGPRLETVAEVEKMARDGCHLIGMTAMPEAALARELGLDYASIAVIDRIAGQMTLAPEAREKALNQSVLQIKTLIEQVILAEQ